MRGTKIGIILVILLLLPTSADTTDKTPGFRMGHQMVQMDKNIILFGGQGNQTNVWQDNLYSDTWIFNSDNGIWSEIITVDSPTPRFEHALAYSSDYEAVYLFGGVTSDTRKSDLWKFDGENWELITDEGPSPRSSHSLIMDDTKNRLVLFGGYNITNEKLDDTWFYYFENNQWEQLSEQVTHPDKRYGHKMVIHEHEYCAYLFGGNDVDTGKKKDLWYLDLKQDSWKKLDPEGPSPRYWFSMAIDQHLQEIMVFGGDKAPSAYGSEYSDETWIYDIVEEKWELKEADGPEARVLSSLVYNDLEEKFVLYGGMAANSFLQDLWVFDGNWYGFSESKTQNIWLGVLGVAIVAIALLLFRRKI